MKEIEENFSPADDAIDRHLLNEITGGKTGGETTGKGEQSNKLANIKNKLVRTKKVDD